MSSQLPVLCIGLPDGHPAIDSHPLAQGPGVDKAQLHAKLKVQLQAMEKSFDGTPYEFEVFYTGPDADFEERYLAKLKEKKWKALVVGFGVRGHPGLTEFFEEVVNMAHKEVPGVVFCFNTSPDSSLASVQRNLPTAAA
ncbi:hypothetical protein RQP46_000561 [Phenoliferia psychrophenolica]